MRSNVTTGAPPSAGAVHGCLLAVRGAASGLGDGRGLAFATLASWLLTESLGAYMLGRWIAAGGLRQQADRVSRPVIFGHAGLAFTGFAGWVSFLITGSAPLAWLAVGLLAPAIGLGVSTVTVWTPFPAHRAGAGPESPADPRRDGPAAPAVPAGPPSGDDAPAGAGLGADDTLARALSDEALSGRLVDDLLARMLTEDPPAARRPKLHLAPLIPAAHGVLALFTVLLAMLAAVAAR